MAYIFEYLNHEFGNTIREGNFYDLGSGTGKAVIAMSLIFRFKRLIGIEFLENLFKLSLGIKQNYDKSIGDKFDNYKQLFNFESPNQIEFLQGDFLKHTWEDTSIIFANSTCFTLNMMNNIANKANKECKPGTIIITFTKRLTNLSADWELRDGFRRLMTWGIATIYIHRRK
jgi:hypothetical protein